MQVVISAESFRKLSPATQNEILSLLLGLSEELPNTKIVQDFDALHVQEVLDADDSIKRRVLAISTPQAMDLLSNLAEKSQQSLRMFAERERVNVDELVGEGRPYKDMNELKRSFVGAVNRRLRTVVGDRSVVLFSSDRNRKRIRVLPSTASALRRAMGIQDLVEEEECFDDFELDPPFSEEPPHFADLPNIDEP